MGRRWLLRAARRFSTSPGRPSAPWTLRRRCDRGRRKAAIGVPDEPASLHPLQGFRAGGSASVGELYIGGYVWRGLPGRPRCGGAIRARPFSGAPGARLYARATSRVLPDGRNGVGGRADDQVKFAAPHRARRDEAALASHADVPRPSRRAGRRGGRQAHRRLLGSRRSGGRGRSEGHLRAAAVVHGPASSSRGRMPLTPNGKSTVGSTRAGRERGPCRRVGRAADARRREDVRILACFGSGAGRGGRQLFDLRLTLAARHRVTARAPRRSRRARCARSSSRRRRDLAASSRDA